MASRRHSTGNVLDLPGTPGGAVTGVYRWTRGQAAHLRAGRLAALGLARIEDETEAVGRSGRDALVSNLAVTQTPMLKWDHHTERRTRSWALSISAHRDRVPDRLGDGPSLKPRVAEAIGHAYRYACKDAARETGLLLAVVPSGCPYLSDDIMERPFSSEPE